jgi:hypothetical protein
MIERGEKIVMWEIAGRLKMPRSTLHNYMRALICRGSIIKRPGQKYLLGDGTPPTRTSEHKNEHLKWVAPVPHREMPDELPAIPSLTKAQLCAGKAYVRRRVNLDG